eukprot:TRINITY_DN10518_c4_g1_i1.p1 TRINITY_DN10518_c4_g1~~TRINITY_DN10518_c4_g1_i1.p1  ORF type:complete len:628 (+),score=137.60 TRINITY_DN10518_c4_g1_i1:217-1884(+)
MRLVPREKSQAGLDTSSPHSIQTLSNDQHSVSSHMMSLSGYSNVKRGADDSPVPVTDHDDDDIDSEDTPTLTDDHVTDHEEVAQDVPHHQPTKGPSRVVLVILRGNHDMPKRRATMHWFWIFSQFGEVERTRLFSKHGNRQFLVQYVSQGHAKSCHEGLDGTVVDGFNLCVILSHKSEITFEGSSCWEFFKQNTQIREGRLTSPLGQLWDIRQSTSVGEVGHCVHVAGLLGGRRKQGALHMSLRMLWRFAGQYGDVKAAKLLGGGKTGCALVQFASVQEADSFKAKVHQAHFSMGDQHFELLVTPSNKPHCASWAHADSDNTIAFTTTPPPLRAKGATLAPSRFVAAQFPFLPTNTPRAVQMERLQQALVDGDIPQPTHMFFHNELQMPAAAYRTLGDAVRAVACLSGEAGAHLQFCTDCADDSESHRSGSGSPQTTSPYMMSLAPQSVAPSVMPTIVGPSGVQMPGVQMYYVQQQPVVSSVDQQVVYVTQPSVPVMMPQQVIGGARMASAAGQVQNIPLAQVAMPQQMFQNSPPSMMVQPCFYSRMPPGSFVLQ